MLPEELVDPARFSAVPSLWGFVIVFGVPAGLLGLAVGLVVSAFFTGTWSVGVLVALVLLALGVAVRLGRSFYRGASQVWVDALQLEPGDTLVKGLELERAVREHLPRTTWRGLPVPLPRVWVAPQGGPAIFVFRSEGESAVNLAVSRAALVGLSSQELRSLWVKGILIGLRPEVPRLTATSALALRLSRVGQENWLEAALGGARLGPVTPEGFLFFLLAYPVLRLLVRRGPAEPRGPELSRLTGAARLAEASGLWAGAPLSLAATGSKKIVLSASARPS